MATKQSYLDLMEAVYNRAVTDSAVKIDSTDKVLTISANGLKTTLGLSYNGSTGALSITGKDNSGADHVIATANLPLEMVLESVDYNSTTHILTFEWNTAAGKENTQVDLTGLIDTYTASNGINITSGAVSVKIDSASDTALTVGTAGLKLDGAKIVHTSGNETIAGVKTFSTHLVVPAKSSTAGNNSTVYATEAQLYTAEANDNANIASAITDFNAA
ncbi:MAG: hypothetical protein LBG17_03165 [Bacteroidales bacterium]|jgi:hypothetical protein|nr:hypothetical protein [Bacteroidales bacterium]